MTITKHIPTSHAFSTGDSELKEFLVNENLSQICYTDEEELRGIIAEKFSTEEDESEWVHKNTNKQKYSEYVEYLVTDEVPSYFNIFECGRNLLNRLGVTYEQACMATKKDK